MKRREQSEQFDVREDEWNSFMAEIEAKAKVIAQNRDRALTLMILAGKVAQYDPTFALGLAEAVKGARREHKATRSVLQTLTRKAKRR